MVATAVAELVRGIEDIRGMFSFFLNEWIFMPYIYDSYYRINSENQSINQSAYFRVAHVTLLSQSHYINVAVNN